MPGSYPSVLACLLEARDDATRELAWSAFLTSYNRLLLHVSRSLGGGHDAAMDRYACILEHLRADEFRRLHTFAEDGRSEFTTWLVVVAQRICLDHRRAQYGRFRAGVGDPRAHDEEWAARRRLVDLLSADVDLSSITDGAARDPEDHVLLADLYHALESALALLDPRDRLLVKLRFEDGLSMPEIARDLGLPSRFHAYRRLAQVLHALRGTLERIGVRDAAP
jgi:RNA polymerase sigma factor (sigma-70 family)